MMDSALIAIGIKAFALKEGDRVDDFILEVTALPSPLHLIPSAPFPNL
jgi:hypothetical protein